MSARNTAVALASLVVCLAAEAQSTEPWRSWNRPVEPFRLIDNIYYVADGERRFREHLAPERSAD